MRGGKIIGELRNWYPRGGGQIYRKEKMRMNGILCSQGGPAHAGEWGPTLDSLWSAVNHYLRKGGRSTAKSGRVREDCPGKRRKLWVRQCFVDGGGQWDDDRKPGSSLELSRKRPTRKKAVKKILPKKKKEAEWSGKLNTCEGSEEKSIRARMRRLLPEKRARKFPSRREKDIWREPCNDDCAQHVRARRGLRERIMNAT